MFDDDCCRCGATLALQRPTAAASSRAPPATAWGTDSSAPPAPPLPKPANRSLQDRAADIKYEVQCKMERRGSEINMHIVNRNG